MSPFILHGLTLWSNFYVKRKLLSIISQWLNSHYFSSAHHLAAQLLSILSQSDLLDHFFSANVSISLWGTCWELVDRMPRVWSLFVIVGAFTCIYNLLKWELHSSSRHFIWYSIAKGNNAVELVSPNEGSKQKLFHYWELS